MRRSSRLLLVITALFLAAGSQAPAQTPAYPSSPVKIVVPFVAGGGVDVVARIIQPPLSEVLGQPVIIENRGGAGGMLGASAVAQSAPDGYTFLLGTGSTHGTNSVVYSKMAYDPVRDFTPVVLVTTSPQVLVVPPSMPVKSVRELIAFARTKPGELSFGSYGIGSINHLGAELFNSMADIKANHIPYRGAAPAMTDLIGGRLHYTFDGIATSLGYSRSGTTRLLAVSALTRAPVLPDLPTIDESGLPGFETLVWFGLFAPAKTPQHAVDVINSKVNAVLALPKVQESMLKLGIEGVGGKPDVLASKVKSEMAKWSTLAREKNIRIEQ